MKLFGILILVYWLSGIVKVSETTISDAEKKEIQFLREEEKLAHDVYLAFDEKWNLPVFANIANSETRHFNAMEFLIDNFNLDDPALEIRGKFKNEKLQVLYDSLVVKGSVSLEEALKVGAFIEEADIYDLNNLISLTSNDTILLVCNNLKGASENHLRAFTRQFEFRDIEYTPQVLSMAEYNSVLNNNSEKGMGNGTCMIQQNNQPNCNNMGNGKRMRRRGNFNQ